MPIPMEPMRPFLETQPSRRELFAVEKSSLSLDDVRAAKSRVPVANKIVSEVLCDPAAADRSDSLKNQSRELEALMRMDCTDFLQAELADTPVKLSDEAIGAIKSEQEALVKNLTTLGPSKRIEGLSGASGKLFGVDLEYWRDSSVEKREDLSGFIECQEMRALELLKMRFFLAGGERITAWIGFRPNVAQYSRINFETLNSSSPIVGLIGISPATLADEKDRAMPAGIVGFFQPKTGELFELYSAIIAIPHSRALVHLSNRLPDKTMRLYESVHEQLEYKEEEEFGEVVALPRMLHGVLLPSREDSIVCTFSVEEDATNVFLSPERLEQKR